MSIKKISLVILILYPILTFSQNNDTIYTYITNFKIKNPNAFSNDEKKIIDNNFIITSSQRFGSTFFQETKKICINSYRLIDVENEDEAINHRDRNNRTNLPIATADNYMQGYIRKTADNYEITTVVKNFNNTFNTFTVYEYLKFSDNDDGLAINRCIDSLAIKISKILCPPCNHIIIQEITPANHFIEIKELISNIKNYNEEKINKQIKIDEKINDIKTNFFNYNSIDVSAKSLIGLWWFNAKDNKIKALLLFKDALKSYCSSISTNDNDLMNQITNNNDIKAWLNSQINKCNQ